MRAALIRGRYLLIIHRLDVHVAILLVGRDGFQIHVAAKNEAANGEGILLVGVDERILRFLALCTLVVIHLIVSN
jgi:hypothetical protein